MTDEGIKEGTYFVLSRMLYHMSVRDQIRKFLQTLSHAGCIISALNHNIKGFKDTMYYEKTDIPTFTIYNFVFRGLISCNCTNKYAHTSYNINVRVYFAGV